LLILTADSAYGRFKFYSYKLMCWAKQKLIKRERYKRKEDINTITMIIFVVLGLMISSSLDIVDSSPFRAKPIT
jgi:hypothetical protein